MKNSISVLFLFLFSILALGQNAQLDEQVWFAQSITDENGTENIKPFTPEMTVQVEFDLANNVLSADLCCAGNFQMNLNLEVDNVTFEGSDFVNTSGTCNDTENNDFAIAVHSFFEDNLASNFSYNITQVNNLVSKLEITNASNETFLFYDSPHFDKNSKVLNETWGYEWHLSAMNMNGNFYNFDTPNQDFGEVTAIFNYDGSFETEVCGTLQANFSLGNDNGSQGFVINCGNISSTLISCDTSESTNIQDLYFSFFMNNVDETLALDFINIDGQTGGCEEERFQLTNSIGDYLEFSSCSLLNVEKNENLSLDLYPNPTKGKLNFQTLKPQQINLVQVFDLYGRVVKNYTQTNHQIDISELPSGIYFLKLNLDGESLVKKIVKH